MTEDRGAGTHDLQAHARDFDSAIGISQRKDALSARQKIVLWVSIAAGVALTLWGLAAPLAFSATTSRAKNWIMDHFDGALMLLNTLFVLCAFALMLGPWGKVRLGPNDSRPIIKTRMWLFLMFASGIDAGIVFWSAAEPLLYLKSGLFGSQSAGSSPDSHIIAAQLVGFGVHSWACYSMSGIIIGYFAFRKGWPLSFSSAIEHALAGRWSGWSVSGIGALSDCVAILAMLFGIGGSLAFGALQLATGVRILGLDQVAAKPLGLAVIALIISGSLAASISGIRRAMAALSNINVTIAIMVLIYVLAAGPHLLLAGRVFETFRLYPGQILHVTAGSIAGLPPYRAWAHQWPLTYFLWSMSWSPFVGGFIAEISRGRTIRQTMAAALLFPTVSSGIWFAVVGGWALRANQISGGAILKAVNVDIAHGLLDSFAMLPGGRLAGAVVVVMACGFMITVSSASILMLAVVSTGREMPAKRLKVFWGCVLAAVASTVIITDNFEVVRATPIFAAVPVTLLALLAVLILFRSLYAELGGPALTPNASPPDTRTRAMALADSDHAPFDH